MVVIILDEKNDGLYSSLYEQGMMIIANSTRSGYTNNFVVLDSAAQAAGDHKDYPNEFAKSRGNYQSALGAVMAKELSESCGWQIAWIRRDNETSDDNVLSVIDLERRFVIFPIQLVRRSQSAETEACLSIYEKIKRGGLPDVPPGSFREVMP